MSNAISSVRDRTHSTQSLQNAEPTLNPKIVKLTAELLNSVGFKNDPVRDLNVHHTGQTMTQMQGNAEFCKKVVKLTQDFPAAISSSYLRDQRAVNETIFRTLQYKRLAHAVGFGLKIKLEDNSEVTLEGFSETFTIPMLRHTFNEFSLSHKDLVSEDLREFIEISLSKAMYHDKLTSEGIAELHKLIHDPTNVNPIVICSGHLWHLTVAIFYQNPRTGGYELWYCNRGDDCLNFPGILCCEICKKENITLSFLELLASRMNVDKSQYKSYGKIIQELELNGHFIDYIRMKPQRVKSCTYVNIKAVIFALMLIKEGGKSTVEKIKEIYKKFVQFDVDGVINDFLIDLYEMKEGSCSNTLSEICLSLEIKENLQVSAIPKISPSLFQKFKVAQEMAKLTRGK